MARYRVVPDRSKIWADARSSLHPISLETTGLEGFLDMTIVDGHLDTNAPVSGSVELDASLLKTGNGLYDRELERKLEMRKYPRVRGRVISAKALDSGATYRVQGELSLRGQTSAVQGDVQMRIVDATTVEFQGEQTIDIRNFGLEPPKFLVLKVYPDVKLRGLLIAELEH
ncbi:MAG TPA: YceI family protein [Candidatus Binatus sp.]|nr:YceI family protein [Candidatus Binatus sp.]